MSCPAKALSHASSCHSGPFFSTLPAAMDISSGTQLSQAASQICPRAWQSFPHGGMQPGEDSQPEMLAPSCHVLLPTSTWVFAGGKELAWLRAGSSQPSSRGLVEHQAQTQQQSWLEETVMVLTALVSLNGPYQPHGVSTHTTAHGSMSSIAA